MLVFFFSSRRRHTRFKCDWSSDVCSSDLPGVERGDVIAGMAAERDADALRLAEREIVALAHIVEAVELHHHVMDHVDAALDEGDAVMARIDGEEIAGERAHPIVAALELEDVLIES